MVEVAVEVEEVEVGSSVGCGGVAGGVAGGVVGGVPKLTRTFTVLPLRTLTFRGFTVPPGALMV